MRRVASLWRAALPALAVLVLALACKSSSSDSGGSNTTVTVSGTVTYTRVPVAKDANGVPTGLETDTAKFTSLPARGVLVRCYQSAQETAPDGTKSTVWKVAGSDAYTDSTGKYSISVPKDTPVFVELVSRAASGIRILGDPSGINSGLNQSDRPLYLLRKALDGTASTTNPVLATSSSAAAVTVDFTVGPTTQWWLGISVPTQVGAATRESQGTGSRVLGIIDSIYAFQTVYTTVLPGAGSDLLDLHYRPGVSETRGTYVEYDRTVFPQAYDPNINNRHYFGSIRGASANDDAWDEAVIWTLLGRNAYANAWSAALKPASRALPHLAPDLAMAEGFALAKAANLLKSPYLADTFGAGATVVDIRDLTGLTAEQKSVYSAPAIAAFAWEAILVGNSIARPGTATTWANINSSAMLRLFNAVLPTDAADSTKVVDTFSIYGQIKRLQEAQGSGEPVNLSALFGDAVLTPLASPFGIAWPRPTTGPLATFLTDWGTDPTTATTALPTLSLSMSTAAQVNGTYPNISEKEVGYARFYLTKDTAYDFQVQTVPALPSGVAIEAWFPGIARTVTFTTGSGAVRIPLTGNSTTPVFYLVRIRVLSPGQVAPDLQATVRLVPVT